MFHEGVLAENALELMRSRYAAYAMNLPDYIIQTTHPVSSNYSDNKFSWKRSISQFSKGSQFVGLEILDFKENKTIATVTFVAHITQEGHDATYTEKSFFEKIRGRWLYRGGELAEGHAPNLVTVGQLRLLPLAYYGDPILRRNGDIVEQITPELRTLIEEMIETMDVNDGIGLAAPQVHHSIRLFILRTPMEKEDGKFDFGEVEVFINPEIISHGQELWKRDEGCLSIPGIRAEVERPIDISVTYSNLEGEKVQKELKGLHARMFMHENDHINGILYVDHLDAAERESLEPFLNKIQSRIHTEGQGDKPL